MVVALVVSRFFFPTRVEDLLNQQLSLCDQMLANSGGPMASNGRSLCGQMLACWGAAMASNGRGMDCHLLKSW